MLSVNYLAVLVGGVAYMALGALWYSPAVFGKVWMRGIGKTEAQLKADFKSISYLWAFIGSLIAAYGIARVLAMFDAPTLADGVKLGLVAGVCLVGASFFINDTFDARPRSLTIVNILYHIIGFIVIGLIIGAWR